MDASREVNQAVTQDRESEGPIGDLEVFVTAGEAYPAFERAFMNAKEQISASFRLFDLTTKLHSPEARELGDTWFDLMVDTLNRTLLRLPGGSGYAVLSRSVVGPGSKKFDMAGPEMHLSACPSESMCPQGSEAALRAEHA